MFGDIKVGDKVWNFTQGEETVEAVSYDKVKTKSGYYIRNSGKLYESDVAPTIYRYQPKIIVPVVEKKEG